MTANGKHSGKREPWERLKAVAEKVLAKHGEAFGGRITWHTDAPYRCTIVAGSPTGRNMAEWSIDCETGHDTGWPLSDGRTHIVDPNVNHHGLVTPLALDMMAALYRAVHR